jgi:hypothetical protein
VVNQLAVGSKTKVKIKIFSRPGEPLPQQFSRLGFTPSKERLVRAKGLAV